MGPEEVDPHPKGLPSATAALPPNLSHDPAPEYLRYTLAQYHRSIERLIALKWKYALVLAGLTVFSALAFTGFRPPATPFAAVLQWFTIAWLLPIPLLILGVVVFFGWMTVARFRIVPSAAEPVNEPPLVIFQVTSTGVNVDTVLHTVRSVLHWTRLHPELGYRTEAWAVIEEWGYAPNARRFDALKDEGVRVLVTPVKYRTPRGTTRKGRALQFAVEARRALGVPRDRVWVYHQDDETAVGEDTVLGIDEFVRDHAHEKALGCGIILYPQHGGDLRPQQVQEFNRTKDDFRTIFTIASRHNVFSGFHGSHYIVRADVEEETGWDVGPDMTSEDLIFENSVRRQHGPICHLLKGFAYEQAALNWRDQLLQRRRWFQGWWRAVLHLPFSPQRRAAMSYSMIVWMAAVFSVAAMLSSWVAGFSSLLPWTGALAGFVWGSMVIGYHQGYVLHRAYLPPRTVSMPRIWANGVVGALLDAIAPWYGTFTRRPRSFEVISKDQRAVPRAAPPSARPRAPPAPTA